MRNLLQDLRGFAKVEGMRSADNGLVDAILKLKRKCRFEEEIGSRFALTPVEMSCLLALPQGQQLECQALAAQMGLSASRGSRIIQRLVTRGLLQREARMDDRRCLLISLSPEGALFRTRIEEARAECERKLLARLDPVQLQKVNEGLDILLARL
jgi:DNA-binding MarR family transcriptional regulator